MALIVLYFKPSHIASIQQSKQCVNKVWKVWIRVKDKKSAKTRQDLNIIPKYNNTIRVLT